MTTFSLTPTQARLLSFLKARMAAGKPPSQDEMRVHLGVASKSTVNRLLNSLEERGYIKRLYHQARAIRLIAQPGDPFDAAREALSLVGAPTTTDNLAKIATALSECRNAA